MFYIENKTKWQKGDIVIHDADAKNHKMLMVVISVDDTGLAKSVYFNISEIVPNCIIRKYGTVEKIPKRILSQYTQTWENDIKYLHDPSLFGIKVTDDDKKRVEYLTL